MLEYEKKILLTKEEYDYLYTIFSTNESYVQTNYYYDSDDYAMNSNGVTCRIREKGGSFIATIKTHKKRQGNCSDERTRKAQSAYDDRLFKNLGVKLQGMLVTHRCRMYRDNEIDVVLDKNIYMGDVDYEIEVEYKNDSEWIANEMMLWVANILCDAGLVGKCADFVKRQQSSVSKSERFFKRLKNSKLQRKE